MRCAANGGSAPHSRPWMCACAQLNIKAKHWQDLVSNQPFQRADIIHLQARGQPFAATQCASPAPLAGPSQHREALDRVVQARAGWRDAER